MTVRSKDIILLLGAGASAEADIPTSAQMIGHIEQLLHSDTYWRPFGTLYNHVKSAIYYAAGLRGSFDSKVSYNIETLVNTLYELERNEEHPLYPFIAAWNSRFVSLAGPNFERIQAFRHLILEALKRWMCPEDASKTEYYSGLTDLQKGLNFTLPVFSLNYDLCVENLTSTDFLVEAGFDGYGPTHVWDWERFDEGGPSSPPQILLYKLHGSINWKRTESTKQLYRVQQVSATDADKMEVIFGRDFKLDAADPYLFYAYEFRRYVLLAKLIVVIGYGFGDEHINKMLIQGIRHGNNPLLFVIDNCVQSKRREKASEIGQRLGLLAEEEERVEVNPGTARQFLKMPELARYLADKMPDSSNAPF